MVIDLEGRLVLPGFNYSHTQLVVESAQEKT
jgi:predicted amidohydrolase YtcJ